MKTIRFFLSLKVAWCLTAFAAEPPPREEWFRGLDLEDAAGGTELIVAARVEEVTEIRLVHGGKGESTTLQFRFKPIRVLKGVFARPELILGTAELASYQLSGSLSQIKAGQTRLLFLGRNAIGYENINGSTRILDHAFPPLTGENDPFLEGIIALLAAHSDPDRARRAVILTQALTRLSGSAAVPVLSALSRRAVFAAQRPDSAPAIIRHLMHDSPAVRSGAASVLAAILAADYLHRPELRDAAAAALKTALTREGPNIGVRAALVVAVGNLGAIKDQELVARLDFGKAGSIAERNAQIRAIGWLGLAGFADQLLAYSQSQPPDSAHDDAAETALASLDAVRGAAEIERRAGEKLAAGLKCQGELRAVTVLPNAAAATLLLRLAELPLNSEEHHEFAAAALAICERLPDERLVAPLAKLLNPDEPATCDEAVSALLRIGSPAAAQALRPQLPREKDLREKLRIAALLGKNGMRDGYPYAIEHVSEPYLTGVAVAALVAMGDPRTIPEARKILETSNDVKWNGAAIRILGALGAKDLAPKFLALAGDRKNPLAPAALVALADLGEPQALPEIRAALAARGDELVIAGAHAARHLLAHPEAADDGIRDQLAALLTDTGASESVRIAALEALAALNDPRLDPALATAAHDAALERTGLLGEVERLLRERKVKLP